MKKLLMIFVLLFAVSTMKLSAWGMTGHRIVAEIAERNLTPEAKKGIDELLGGQSLAYWANWGDFIKSDTLDTWKHTYIWHYVNAPSGLSKAEFVNYIKQVKQDNVYSEIPKLEAIVKDKNQSKENRRYALIFLIHLAGDAHQPMHVGREEDLGGNRVKLKWFGEDVNLHSLWDSKLIDFEQYSYTEYASALNVVTEQEKEAIEAGELEDWLFESHEIASYLYGMVNEGDELKFDYQFKTKDIMESQLRKGGLRLAKILNSLF